MATPLEGTSKRVDLEAIERELSQLWKSAGESAGQAVTRACALNLVVYVERQEVALRVGETIAHVAVHDPNRAIVVVAEASAESGLDAWISTHCFLPTPNSPQVCCEQITISARGAAVEQAPGLVLPLLVADLPVVLWWPGDPPLESSIFARFSDSANRVILDSASFAEPCETLTRLARRVGGTSRGPTFGDLNWTRLTSWRELTAQFFDSPDMLAYLGEIRSVRVEYAARQGEGPNPAQASLLVGWLGSRLGWRLDAGAGLLIDCARLRFLAVDGQAVEVELVPIVRDDVSVGSLLRLAIETQREHRAVFSVAREASGNCVATRTEVEGKPPIERIISLGALTEHHLLCQELEFPGRDQIFEESLALIAGL